ncbi:hypothetical protein [Pontibacter sp. G13]|uniref:hypothetical protein n=1 Tax=Pontibacter sp. G13 TaxID=3074898 RepID=UPI00288931B2|nr:hypothetical protein [Pontibacter sp. G13]WNJ19401.1 hypothetical protein RJD25_02820 [Pontibacter sp. G13]
MRLTILLLPAVLWMSAKNLNSFPASVSQETIGQSANPPITELLILEDVEDHLEFMSMTFQDLEGNHVAFQKFAFEIDPENNVWFSLEPVPNSSLSQCIIRPEIKGSIWEVTYQSQWAQRPASHRWDSLQVVLSIKRPNEQ